MIEEALILCVIWKEDNVRPTLFNLIMKSIRITNIGYRMERTSKLCAAYDLVSLGDSENNLQCMICSLRQQNMKTQSVVVSKELIRCKLMIDYQVIEEVRTFNYLGMAIFNKRNIETEVLCQPFRAMISSRSLI